MSIHPTAQVHPGAVIGADVTIGPFSIVDEEVRIGDGCAIAEHVVIRKHTTLGARVRVFPFAVVGEEPQHMKFKGETTYVTVGDDTVIRESVTIHRGTAEGSGRTIVGKNCLIMAYCHVAHDCVVGDHVIMANAVQLAGHAVLEDYVFLGGISAVTQFCRVGRHSYVGGCSILRKDLAPFLVGKGNEFEVQGINAVGLTRRGYSAEAVSRLRSLYRIFFRQHLTVSQAIERVSVELGDAEEVRLFVDFVKGSKRGIIR